MLCADSELSCFENITGIHCLFTELELHYRLCCVHCLKYAGAIQNQNLLTGTEEKQLQWFKCAERMGL
jgi:hypothetical protein